jgi:outer membrane protein OmpA-like peptidoglycan-associated protein
MKKSKASNFLRRTIFIVALCTQFLKPFDVLSQTNPSSEKVTSLAKKANTKYAFKDYNVALPMYLELLKFDSTKFLYNYRAGVCYLKSNMETAKSVAYFETASKYKGINDGGTFEFHYYMGYAYHITNRFDEAIASFTLAKTFPNSVDSIVDKEIKQCEIAKSLKQTKSDLRIFNLGTNVNSIYPDYSPLMLPDQSLIYTSPRKGSTGGKKTIDGGDFYEDIYIAKNQSVITTTTTATPTVAATTSKTPVFANAKNAGILINTKTNDASIALSPDGGVFYMYRKEKVWQSYVSNGMFTKPRLFKTSVFEKTDVAPSIYFTNDGKEMYFVSARLGGYGGKDIYKATLQADGTWGAVQNLGSIVNTKFDEESPFFDSEEKTLYYSSQGLNSIGGFDVFKSKLQANNTWGVPENLGFPINSGTDDIFYSFDKKTNTGFYTTMRKDGVGNYDITMIKRLQPINVSLLATYKGGLAPKNLNVTVMNLESANSLKKLPVNQRNTVSYESNKEYLMLIPRYNSDSILDTLYFKTPETCDTYNSLQEIVYEPVKNNRGLLLGYKTTIYNAFFDIEKEIVKSGVRNQRVLIKSFPMSQTIIPALSYYKNDKLTQEEEYSGFVRYIKPDRKNFKIYTQTNYVDTSNFAILYKIQDSLAAEAEMQKARDAYFREQAKAEQARLRTEEEILAAEAAKAAEIAALPIFRPVHFELTKSEFLKKYEGQMQEIADFMKKYKSTRLDINGYTDSMGRAEFNKALSWDRAITIKRVLMKKGIAGDRMMADGKGETTAPTNGAEDAEKNNRKVVFIIKNTRGISIKK